MQKQKIDPTLYFAIQNSYDDIQIAFYNKSDLISKKIINKAFASKDLVLTLDSLLKENGFSIDDLTFITVNQGPGPFTTLRVVITTANALNFGGNLPLIGVDGLDAIIEQYKDSKWPITVALLNAFNKDVYFAIDTPEKLISKGWKNIELFLNDLKSEFAGQKIRFLGNGADLYKNEIQNIFQENAFIPENNPQICSIEQIATMGFQKWKNKKDIVEELIPLYLKDAVIFKTN